MPVSVLVLESHDSRAYADALSQAGFHVWTAADVTAAYEAAAQGSPEVIVATLDHRAPDASFAVCERFKADARTRDIPVLLTSVSMEEADIARATSAGVLALALPPADATKLVSAIQGIVAAHRRPAPARAVLKQAKDEDPARSA